MEYPTGTITNDHAGSHPGLALQFLLFFDNLNLRWPKEVFISSEHRETLENNEKSVVVMYIVINNNG